MQDLQVIDILPQMITLSEAYIQVGPLDYSLKIVYIYNCVSLLVIFYQVQFSSCFISPSRSGRGKKKMWQTTTKQYKWVLNKNHIK